MYRNYLTFGDLLKAHRVIRGLSQEDLSWKCDYLRDRSYISKLERKLRKPTSETVKILIDALELKGRDKALFTVLSRVDISRKDVFVVEAILSGDASYAKTFGKEA